MIQSVTFENFKSIRQMTMSLDRLTVLVGANGSGKSSVLEGLYYLSQLTRIPPKEFFHGDRDLLYLYQRGGSGDLILSQQTTEDVLELRAAPSELLQDILLRLHPSDAELVNWQPAFRKKESGVSGEGTAWDQLPARERAFRSAIHLRLDAKQLVRPSYGENSIPMGEFDGTGTPSALAFMALNQPDRFAELQDNLRRIIPIVKRVRFDRAPVVKYETEIISIGDERLPRRIRRDLMGDSLIFDMQSITGVSGHMASEGTLLVLGLLTVLCAPNCPQLVLIDDLDHGIHPKAQGELIDLIRELLKSNEQMQIVATSHSPYLLDKLKPHEVRCLGLRADMTTAFESLDKHPEFEEWKKQMMTGEMWSVFGDTWVAEPVKAEMQRA